MWMGKASAWGALAMGAMFAVNAYLQFATGVSGWVYAGTALVLLVGAFRTLRQMSGGLRLLAAAWGFAAGLLILPLTMPRGTFSEFAQISGLEIAFVLVALTGAALTVLHREKKP
jgi:hypothetical protein